MAALMQSLLKRRGWGAVTDGMAQARQLAAALRPLRVRDGIGRLDADRVTTVDDCVAGARKAAVLARHACSHVLIPAADDPDHFLAQPVYPPMRSLGAEHFLCDTPAGPLLLTGDTLVYWH